MNIDERLERLAERTESMARTTEILLGLQMASERRFAEMKEQFSQLNQQVNQRFAETPVFINQLAHVAELHEHRLDRLEKP